ncbi:MAG: lysine-2,3-aminomutase-like protein [Xanthobacter sp.]
MPRPQNAQSQTLRSIQDLEAAGLIDAQADSALEKVARRYAIAITPTLTELIGNTDANDPVARQFIPQAEELVEKPEELADPIGDEAHSPVPGIVHRYPDRALLKIVGVCAVYCRFCFRREMVGPGAETILSGHALDSAITYLADHPEIWEVILTGGDPFMLSPRRMRDVVDRLNAIAHIRIIRFHTRVPIAAPERVDAAFIAALKAPDLTSYVAIHINHSRELSPDSRAALARMVDAGIPLVSQTVLLRGVNDDEETLATLFRALVECRVTPYYLHHPDLAPGTSHFRLTFEEGQTIMRKLRGRLSGIAIPTYVLDIPGGAGKVPLTPQYATLQEEGRHVVTDIGGRPHAYPPTP